MKRHRLFIIFFLLTFLFRFSCSDEELDEIKFYVKSTEGNFTGGTYKRNGGTTVAFNGIGIGSNVYEYELELDDVDYLEVSARKVTEDQSVEIRIYRDGVKVKSDKLEPYEQSGTTYLYDLNLDYEYGEEETSSG
ncbi:MAG: hypothetical protein JXN64_00515 [Spirochaetes bacterium]|nr:hypothetical protein [Spirochaetota bacterium]